MGKVKIKKKSTWIDMTPMSDVMVLLLTFFMLTSTFVKSEPVKVVTPGSVSEIKVPETNVLNILVNNDGKVFMNMDKVTDLEATLASMTSKYGVSLNGVQIKKFKDQAMFGTPVEDLPSFLNKTVSEMGRELPKQGIPTDSVQGGMSQFQVWVQEAKAVNPEMKLSIKADEKTPYRIIKKIMSELQDMNENRYYLITSYKKVEE